MVESDPSDSSDEDYVISLRCLLDDMTMRSVALVQLHLHRRQTPLYLLYLSG